MLLSPLLSLSLSLSQDRNAERAKEMVAHHFMDADEIREASVETPSSKSQAASTAATPPTSSAATAA